MPRQGKPAIELTVQERLLLGKIRANSLSKFIAIRVDIIVRASRGQTNYQIAQQLGISRNTVRQWRTRFERERVWGLRTLPISGRPKKVRTQ